MDATSYLLTALLAFFDNYPYLAPFTLILYVFVAGLLSIVLCANLRDLSTWLPPVFLPDGILVCCCPLAAVLSILLWPLMVVCFVVLLTLVGVWYAVIWPLVAVFCVLLDSLRWFLAAPTFCGIRREAFIGLYMACCERLRRWGRGRRDRKQRQALLPVANGGPGDEPGTGYGAINGSRTRVEQEQYSSPRSQRMQYARQPPFQSDAASVVSAPPRYQE